MKIFHLITAAILTIFVFAAQSSFAAIAIKETDYFASLRSNETNVRSGPGHNYPVKFTFRLRGVPVHIVNEYDNWNEIEDYEGHTGWVMQSLLTKKRTLMVRTSKGMVDMHSKSSEKSRIYFRLENNVIGEYLGCENDWCGIKIKNKKGWVMAEDVFGD